MQKWEYCAMYINIDNSEHLVFFKPTGRTDTILKSNKVKGGQYDDVWGRTVAELGLDGWEMYSTNQTVTNSSTIGPLHIILILHFKRPLS